MYVYVSEYCCSLYWKEWSHFQVYIHSICTTEHSRHAKRQKTATATNKKKEIEMRETNSQWWPIKFATENSNETKQCRRLLACLFDSSFARSRAQTLIVFQFRCMYVWMYIFVAAWNKTLFVVYGFNLKMAVLLYWKRLGSFHPFIPRSHSIYSPVCVCACVYIFC